MIAATLAVIVRDNRVLLGYKKKGAEEISDILNGPGGKMKPGESPEQCVVRETEEELGIVLDIESLVKVALLTFFAGGVADFVVHTYLASRFSGEPAETRCMVPHWFPVDAVPYDRMLESDKLWFPLALRGEQFSAHVHYRERAKGFEHIEYLPFKDELPQ